MPRQKLNQKKEDPKEGSKKKKKAKSGVAAGLDLVTVRSDLATAKKISKKPETEVAEKRGEAPEVDGEVKEEIGSVEKPKKPDRYFEAVGRRKTAVARVRLFTKAGDFVVNDKPWNEYFPILELQKIVEDSLQKMKLWGRFRVSVKTSGGGIHSQAEAVRHGLARCLTKFNPDFRKRLKRAGFLTRDSRMKERKKFGLKKARRAPQWQKR